MNASPLSCCTRQWVWVVLVALVVGSSGHAQPLQVLPEGQRPDDVRLGPLKDLDGYFPFTPPETAAGWEVRAERVRRQVLVTLGLWPMPTRTPLNPVIHGRLEQDGYTVEKVFFESLPGFFVAGNLYRPAGATGRRPVVLSPHGHWANGRFLEVGEAAARREIAQGAERFLNGARSPLQARCVQLARMGCVVFHFDMIGYADTRQISEALAHGFRTQRPEMNHPERWGLYSPRAESHFQSVMGLQTWNSIRALDFLLGLPDADPERVAVTGASGGGTQSFILAAIDPRVHGTFPAVMVSTAMQGGCTCENAAGLRIGTGNIEFAALAAPTPQGLTSANDWTREMATKGFPELKALYGLLGAADRVELHRGEHFGHNYNHVSRTAMYGWINRLFGLGLAEPVLEEDFVRLSAGEMTVWNDAHPAPPGGPDFERQLLAYLARDTRTALEQAWTDAEAFHQAYGKGIEIVVGRTLTEAGEVAWHESRRLDRPGGTLRLGEVRNRTWGESLPAVRLEPAVEVRGTVLWITGAGKAGMFAEDGRTPRPEVVALLNRGFAVLGADLLEQGEFRPDGEPLARTRRVNNPRESAAYTLGYNHSLFAQRAHDVLTLVRLAQTGARPVFLIGLEGGGPWSAAALAVASDELAAAAIDTGGFRFHSVDDIRAPEFLPGGARYGDLPGMLAVGLPGRLAVAGEGAELPAILDAAVKLAGGSRSVHLLAGDPAGVPQRAVAWLMEGLID